MVINRRVYQRGVFSSSKSNQIHPCRRAWLSLLPMRLNMGRGFSGDQSSIKEGLPPLRWANTGQWGDKTNPTVNSSAWSPQWPAIMRAYNRIAGVRLLTKTNTHRNTHACICTPRGLPKGEKKKKKKGIYPKPCTPTVLLATKYQLKEGQERKKGNIIE